MSEPKEPQAVILGAVEDPELVDVGFTSSLPDALVVHFASDPPHGLAFVGQAREKFFAQVMQAGFLLGMTVELGQEEISAELEKKPTLH